MTYFLTSNSAGMRLLRTIVQAIIGVIIANMDILIGETCLSPGMRTVIVGLVMAVLSPIMAEIGRANEGKEEE